MSNDMQITDFDFEDVNDEDIFPPSKRHRIRMNRIFRERVGGVFLPFPEVDNIYERIRSWLVIKFNINEFLDRREERTRAKRKRKTRKA